MIEYLKYFFNPSHLFTITPPQMSERAIAILAVIFAATIAIGIFAGLKAKSSDGLTAKGLNRIKVLGWTMGLIGFAYLFFAWQRVAVLGGRFWLLIWLGVGIIWLFFIIVYLKVEVPQKKEANKKTKEFRKYLPKQG